MNIMEALGEFQKAKKKEPDGINIFGWLDGEKNAPNKNKFQPHWHCYSCGKSLSWVNLLAGGRISAKGYWKQISQQNSDENNGEAGSNSELENQD